MMCTSVIADIYLHTAFRGPFGNGHVPLIPLVILVLRKSSHVSEACKRIVSFMEQKWRLLNCPLVAKKEKRRKKLWFNNVKYHIVVKQDLHALKT